MNNVSASALAGFTATVPMTLSMEAFWRMLPRRSQEPLPPRLMTDKVTTAVGARPHLDEGEQFALSLVNHFAYGTTVGALYRPLTDRIPGPSVAKGVAFGLAVWAVGYLGWVPALGLYRHPAQEPRGRNALLIATHVVWGAALGLLADRWAKPHGRPSQSASHG